MGYRKLIVSTEGEVSQEHWGESFKEVNARFDGKDVELRLERYEETEAGLMFKDQICIGNCKYGLNYDDYLAAYDQLF